MLVETKNEPRRDEMLILCSSFEERSLGFAKLIDKNYLAKHIMIFIYDDESYFEIREKRTLELIKILETKGSLLHKIYCNRENPIDGLDKLRNLLKKEKIYISKKNITFDITVFTKQYLLVLLKYLDQYEKSDLRFVYSKPKRYAQHTGKPLTEGIKKIVTIPSYEGRFAPNKQNSLVLFLGYEADRAYQIFDNEIPNKTICLIGKPGFEDGWSELSEKLNQRILLSENVYRLDTSISDPVNVFNILEKIFKENNSSFNISISPLGTKLQTLGVYLFTKKHPEIKVIYALPKKYLAIDYSSGISSTDFLYLPED